MVLQPKQLVRQITAIVLLTALHLQTVAAQRMEHPQTAVHPMEHLQTELQQMEQLLTVQHLTEAHLLMEVQHPMVLPMEAHLQTAALPVPL